MATLKQLLVLLAFIATTQIVIGQELKIPENYTLEKKEDYAQHEKDIINCINWLVNTPINNQVNKRKEASTFLMNWLAGSPNVTIEISSLIINFTEKNPDLLINIYGWMDEICS